MKFGDTLHERSIPRWAAYNFNYNDIKHMIKRRTTKGIAEPLPIPGQSKNRWAELEDELFQILKAQYDNISLFLRSKYGEIDRRLAHLEKQLRGAQRAIEKPDPRSVLRARQYHKLIQEADRIGEDVQALSRFASVQKVAFRKILKKYRKWTHSTDLQVRLDKEVFSSGGLDLDFANQLDRLSKQSKIVTHELQGPMLRGESPRSVHDRLNSPVSAESPVPRLNEAITQGLLRFDAAFASLPYGPSAGIAAYWIHPDNLEEARVLLLRHMQELTVSAMPSPNSSMVSGSSHNPQNVSRALTGYTHVVLYDNAHRFLQDVSHNRPSRVALSARWNRDSDAVVTTTQLSTHDTVEGTMSLRRKDLVKALTRDASTSSTTQGQVSHEALQIRAYLLENRDVKPIAELQSTRSRLQGHANSSKVGTWATLDTNVVVTAPDSARLGKVDVQYEEGETFPHAVLEIRWEFGRTPEIVRAFDTSHLAERVRDFSLESAAIHILNKDLVQPTWGDLLEKDIRKIPISTRMSMASRRERNQPRVGTSSGTSSTDGPTDSVFSTTIGHSSNTSDDTPYTAMHESDILTDAKSATGPSVSRMTKKKARIDARSPPGRETRYWNEFDDGDSDVNPDDGYAIYVDPDAKVVGAETVEKIIAAAQRGFNTCTASLMSWLPRTPKSTQGKTPNERTQLIVDTGFVDGDSSDSDSSPVSDDTIVKKHGIARQMLDRRSSVGYGTAPQLSPRRRALYNTYFRIYVGLFIMSYILLFMSAVLLSTGRKKARLQVDSGIIIGSIMAEVCAAIALGLAWIRSVGSGIVHWGIISVTATGVVVIGVALLTAVLGREVT